MMKILKVKNSWFKNSDLRLDASFHLSDGPLTIKKFKSSPYEIRELGKCAENIYRGNIFRRVFVDNPEKGYKYLTASDMNKSDIRSGKFLSKKHTKLANLMLDKGWILISCSGTIGNTVFTNEDFENVVGTHDLIRIIPNKIKILPGFLYAYLSSKYGYGLLTQSGYGGVVQHIEPHHIENLPVPIFPEEKQRQIHQLIVEASELRVEANRLLNEAIIAIEGKCPNINNEKMYSIKIRERFFHSKRLEANYNSKSIDKFYSELSKNEIELKSIAELSQSVFTPNIFKRIRTENPETGMPFLSGSELLQQYPRFQNYLSKGMKNIENYVLKDGWLAIQDAGTIGYLSYIHKYLDGVTATNNLIRIIPSEDNYNYYIYAFLKSDVGQKLLKFLEFGSVQKHIDNHQISNFKIPIFKDVFENISRNVENAMNCFSDACFKENQAIALIEKEIDLWQVS